MKLQTIFEKMRRLITRNKIGKAAAFVTIAAMAVLLSGALYFKDVVYITDNGVTREIKTNFSDVYAILSSENYELGADDTVTVETDADGVKHITVTRAFAVYITADGETVTVYLTGGTVADALEKAGITVDEDDCINYLTYEELCEDMEIRVTRIEYVTRYVECAAPFETVYIDNSNLAIGTENVVTEGVDGERVLTYVDKIVENDFAYSELTDEEITVEPVTCVIERGTACAVPYAQMDDPEALTLVDGIPESYTRVVSGKATAYSAKAGALTASGRYAVVGTVAVNPNVIPYGSELYIVSQDRSIVYGYAIAADTGTGLLDGTVTVDVFMASYEDSCKWGAVYVDIYVISEGDNRYIGSSER